MAGCSAPRRRPSGPAIAPPQGLLSVVAPDSVKSVTLKAGATTKAASFEVEVGVGFMSGILRVYAKNQVALDPGGAGRAVHAANG